MKIANFNASFLLAFSLLTISSAGFSERMTAEGRGVCTRDYNAWGHPSVCNCKEGSVYSKESGYCLKGEREDVMLQGTLMTRVVAIGGETTGITITTSEGSFDLIMTNEMRDRMMNADGLYFEVEGEKIRIKGIERTRNAIIVKRLDCLE
ncbi:MAG: hypothetical protein HQK54_11160 [Oligoflexales bacterium]|nr:hypothetical protein [Oligoflexales bacterium]